MARGWRWRSSRCSPTSGGERCGHDILGDWDVTIKTPIGSLAVVYTFTDDDGTRGHRDG